MFQGVMAFIAIVLISCIASCADSGDRGAAREIEEGSKQVGQEAKKVGNSAAAEGVKKAGKVTGRAVETGVRKSGKAIKKVGVNTGGTGNGR